MTRTCSTPGCATLTFGEICLGCLQRKAKAHGDGEHESEPQAGGESRADTD